MPRGRGKPRLALAFGMEEPYSGELVEVAACDTEFEAETIVQALRAQGLAAVTGGGALAGQWAALGKVYVQVLVRKADLERARLALRAVQAESVDLDWQGVDVGDHTPVSARERAGLREPRSGGRPTLFRFAICFIALWAGLELAGFLAINVMGLGGGMRTAGTRTILLVAAFVFAAAMALNTGPKAAGPRSGEAD